MFSANGRSLNYDGCSMDCLFERYVGIDYSGAQTASSSLSGLRIYVADRESSAKEILPPVSPKKYWTRKGIAQWLVEKLSENRPTLVGIDHGFSFPIQYFKQYGLPLDWATFLDDFQRHWPTDDDIYVDFVRDGHCGNGAARSGSPRWRRITELRARTAKSVFHFDVQGSVAKSTHAGLPWLRYIRVQLRDSIHFWPFDGWNIPFNCWVIAEVYPAIWNRTFSTQGRNPHQQDAFAIAEWMRLADADNTLGAFFSPQLDPDQRRVAEIEGWILGIT
jgi:hypothetical protein